MWIWIGFVLGQWLHIALRTQNMLRSPKNDCNSLAEIARRYGLEIAARVGLAAAGLGLWAYSGEAFNALVGRLGLPPLPLMWGTAFAYGLAADVLLDSAGERWPILRRIWKGNGATEDANGRP